MKKISMTAALILFVVALAIGGIGSYIYLSSRQDCARAIARAEEITRTATARSDESKKDAEYARRGAVMICENSKERCTNALLFGAVGFILCVVATLIFFLHRTDRIK